MRKERACVAAPTILTPYQQLGDYGVISRRLVEPLERDMGVHRREPRHHAIDLEHEDLPSISSALFEHGVEIVPRDGATGAEPAVDRSLGILQLGNAVEQ